MCVAETMSVTSLLTERLQKWQLSDDRSFRGSLGARVVGFIATPLTLLVDSVVQAIFFICKSFACFAASFYQRVVAQRIPGEASILQELEISSTVRHLSLALTHLFHAVLQPLLFIVAPARTCLLQTPAKERSFSEIAEQHQRRLFLEREQALRAQMAVLLEMKQEIQERLRQVMEDVEPAKELAVEEEYVDPALEENRKLRLQLEGAKREEQRLLEQKEQVNRETTQMTMRLQGISDGVEKCQEAYWSFQQFRDDLDKKYPMPKDLSPEMREKSVLLQQEKDALDTQLLGLFDKCHHIEKFIEESPYFNKK